MSIKQAPQARAASPGCFYIPAIDASVPARFSQELQRSQTLARFAAAAAAIGVPLPSGNFLNIEQVVHDQWAQFIASRFPQDPFSGAPAHPVFRVTDESLEVVITSHSSLNVYRLKPVVEALESLAAGLGWFVQSILQAGSYHAHEMYDMGMVSYMLDALHWNMDEYTDEAYARMLMMDMGQDPPDGPIPKETIDQLRDEYSYWPSDLIAMVEGHEHLLSISSARPPMMTARKAKAWLRDNGSNPLAAVVQTAVELKAAYRRDKDRAFIWNGSEDETETLGALCFVAWDDPRLLLEAVDHHEQNQYNGGQAVEAFARCMLDLTNAGTEADLRRLARSTVDYFNRWALLGKLLSHFPIWESDDET